MFPDIYFTCNVTITKWIVGAGMGGGGSPPSEVQIWRNMGARSDSYTKVSSTSVLNQSGNLTVTPMSMSTILS